MKSIEKYYDNTETKLPHKNIKQFLQLNPKSGNAIELGCGAGRDTVYLIKNNWNVLAIDREDTEERITKKLNKEELEKFKFEKNEFENVTLPPNNLVLANFSLPFCNKNKFKELWKKINNSILPNRILCRKFFWYKG